jgi:hypothetical protein
MMNSRRKREKQGSEQGKAADAVQHEKQGSEPGS